MGREHEVGLLLDLWQQAKAGEGQVALISGEPGIGKSRLAQAARERVQSETHSRLRYQCSPFHINSPLHPVIEQLERAAGISRDDTTETKLNKLEALLSSGCRIRHCRPRCCERSSLRQTECPCSSRS